MIYTLVDFPPNIRKQKMAVSELLEQLEKATQEIFFIVPAAIKEKQENGVLTEYSENRNGTRDLTLAQLDSKYNPNKKKKDSKVGGFDKPIKYHDNTEVAKPQASWKMGIDTDKSTPERIHAVTSIIEANELLEQAKHVLTEEQQDNISIFDSPNVPVDEFKQTEKMLEFLQLIGEPIESDVKELKQAQQATSIALRDAGL